ncbi:MULTISPECIES: arsenate reductase family protein [unclassified Aureispira]|uniref:arsenate reductase family protein n=1 Tax=unclassified Aureispira TaxID=2649989 RepID=UPI000695A91E|nr:MULTISPECIES: ArsC/Spx/MgsR family protein [unclassified Aureispira]WMX17231.1 ArsC/Spx/MgsR family protein [Aureispira sp. CCB-E]
MKKVYYLSTCSTCKRILSEVDTTDFELQDLKKEALSEEQVEELRQQTESYESLINRRATKYKEMGLKDKNLSEEDYKELLLSHYTFLKRPVFVFEEAIFVGNAKKTVEALKDYLA